MKKYKLLQWYPAIPKWLEVGDTVENTKDIPDCYEGRDVNNKILNQKPKTL